MTTTLSDGITDVIPTLVTGWESTRDARNILHDIIGRADFDVTLRPAGLRSGTLEMLFSSLDNALAAEALLVQAKSFTLEDTDRPTLNMTFVASGSITVAIDEDTRTLWTVACDFQEVDA